jgi:glycosyltransferase involved in cell wall biosynthesis
MIQLSVVVPYHNEAIKIPALLDSINTLNFDRNKVEFIFVSNNSTDESDSLVRAAGHQLEIANRLRSSYYARNIGISSATGDYIVFVDADCILDKNILNAYARRIEKHKEDGFRIYAGDVQPAAQKGSLVESYSAARRVLNQKSAATGWAYKPFAQTANAMFSRRDLIRIHGFNENMTSGGDAEICWRLSENYGHQVVLCEEAIVYHQHRETVEDFINQFMKYGSGRFQQTLVSELFAKEKKPDDFATFKDKSVKILEELVTAGCNEDILYKLLDLFMGIYFNLGFLEESIKSANRSFNGVNYEYITYMQKHFVIIPTKTKVMK